MLSGEASTDTTLTPTFEYTAPKCPATSSSPNYDLDLSDLSALLDETFNAADDGGSDDGDDHFNCNDYDDDWRDALDDDDANDDICSERTFRLSSRSLPNGGYTSFL